MGAMKTHHHGNVSPHKCLKKRTNQSNLIPKQTNLKNLIFDFFIFKMLSINFILNIYLYTYMNMYIIVKINSKYKEDDFSN